MDAIEISQKIKDTKKSVDDLQSSAFDFLALHDKGSLEHEELLNFYDEYKGVSLPILEHKYLERFKEFRVNLDILNSDLDIRDPYIVPDMLTSSSGIYSKVSDYNIDGKEYTIREKRAQLWSMFSGLYEYMERLENLAKTKFSKFDTKKPVVKFQDGSIIDEENNITIHKFGVKDKAYAVCSFIFSPNNKNKWFFWDEIAEYIAGGELSDKPDLKYKVSISDSIRLINKYCTDKIGVEVIKNDGKQRYMIMF